MTQSLDFAIAGLFSCLMSASVLADPALPRVVQKARSAALLSPALIDQAEAQCSSALCFAETLATGAPNQVRVEPVHHPDTDSIRWAKTKPSLVSSDKTGAPLKLHLTHFGRKAPSELREALTGAGRRRIELDLRGNAGGDFERMMEIAGLLLGPIDAAVEVSYLDRTERRSIRGTAVQSGGVTRVLIDQQTASAALLLARLLETYAGAELKGHSASKTPITLKNRIAIDHDWRMILPIATLGVIEPPTPAR